MVQPLFYSARTNADDQAQLTFRTDELVIRQAHTGETTAWPYKNLQLVETIRGTDGIVLAHEGNEISRLKIFEREDREAVLSRARHLRIAYWRKNSILFSPDMSSQMTTIIGLAVIGLIWFFLS